MSSLRRRELLQVLFRSFFVQASWNRERMLGLGFSACFVPFLRARKQRADQHAEFLERSTAFFNTHPYMTPAIVGAIMNLEERGIEPQKIDRFKKQLASAFGAVGDQLFWVVLRTIGSVAGVLLALYFGVVGLVAFMITYNVPHLIIRVRGLQLGYRFGFQLVDHFSPREFRRYLVAGIKLLATLTGLTWILAGYSIITASAAEFAAFLSGMIGMWCLLKCRVSVPLALIILLFLAVISGLA